MSAKEPVAWAVYVTIPRETTVSTITRPAALVRQGSLKLYTTALKVGDLKLKDFYKISKLDPEDEGPGYQRLLDEGRAKRLADYLPRRRDHTPA